MLHIRVSREGSEFTFDAPSLLVVEQVPGEPLELSKLGTDLMLLVPSEWTVIVDKDEEDQ